MTYDFPYFEFSEEHLARREAVRAVARDKIAPFAADVDASSRFPTEAYDALVASGFHAPTCPRSTTARARTRWRPAW